MLIQNNDNDIQICKHISILESKENISDLL
jgi:hypothetical protein